MTMVYTSPWVFVDLETTGLRQDADKIIEIGLARREDAAARLVWDRLVNPAQALDPFISRFTGISDAMLTDAPLIGALREAVCGILENAVIVAHNASFDVGFLERELGIQIGQDMVVDTIELSKILFPGLRSYSLRNLIRAFQIPTRPNHRAKDDAVALEQLFIYLARKALSLPRPVLQKVVEALGGEDRGLASFFTGLLMGHTPGWLAHAIEEQTAQLASQDNGNRQELPYGNDGHSPYGQGQVRVEAVVPDPYEPSAFEGDLYAQDVLDVQEGAYSEQLFAFTEDDGVRQNDQPIAMAFWRDGSMDKMLDEDGVLADRLDNYQYRGQQVEMLGAVAKAFADDRYLMVEAPTGVGKSLAYLIPAICWAKAHGQRVVVATHTIALQEQLYHKEIDLLRALLPFSFRSAMLKGRGNYLCLNRWRQVVEEGRNLIWGERVLLAKIAVWQSEGGQGDLDGLHLFGMEREWFSQMASSRETCQGRQCLHYRDCFFQKARLGANAAHLVVINHALLLSGTRLGEKVLPPFSYLIIDEAHHLEEDGIRQFTEAFSLMEFEKKLQRMHRRRDVFGRSGFLQYLKEYRESGLRQLENFNPHLEQMEKQLKRVMRRVDSLQAVLQSNALPESFRIKPGARQGDHLTRFFTEMDNLLVMAGELGQTIDRLALMLQGEEGELFEENWRKQQLTLFQDTKYDMVLLEAFLRGIKGPGADPVAIATGENGGEADAEAGTEASIGVGTGASIGAGTGVSIGAGTGVSIGAGIGVGIEADADAEADPMEEKVYWITRDSRQKNIILHLTPVDISACFQKYLFEGKASIVFTSATLSVNGGFAYSVQQLGIDPDILDSMVLSSPFDHRQQVLLLSDRDLPDPARTAESAYNLALASSLEILLEACGGGSMVLFTSHKQLRAMYEALHQPLSAMGLELFADGQNGNRTTLLEELRTNGKAVVFGASTYWEGVDLPGLFLTSLFIVRLPFSPPGQPLVEARMERLEKEGKDPFHHYSLPQAVLRFKQGYGRLIRTAEDWGVVVVLDNRIINKSYGRVFRQSLPDGNCIGASPRALAEKILAWKKEKTG